jgi:hypothetical protein
MHVVYTYLFHLNALKVHFCLVLETRYFLRRARFDVDFGLSGSPDGVQPNHFVVVLDGIDLLAL